MAWLLWLVCAQMLGFYAWPIVFAFYRRLPDRGYAVAKLFGLLLGGVLFWTLWAYGLVPNAFAGAWAAALLLALAAAGLSALDRQADTAGAFRWLRDHRGEVLAAEAIFLTVYAGWLLVRARDPGVSHTEQPMDLMLLSSLWNSREFPPRDAWLHGYGVCYYYLGQWLTGFLGRLANQPPETAYNLGQATWYALLATGTFGLGRNLLTLAFPVRRRLALAGGCASALAVCFTGNVRGTLDALAATRPSHWMWRAARAAGDTAADGSTIPLITEFPFFSYWLGDNHAHVLAMPFLLLTLATALNLRLGREAVVPRGPVLRRMLSQLPLRGAGGLLCAVIAGALLPLNTWDFPAGWLMLVAAYPSTWDRRGMSERLMFAGTLTVGSVLLFLPYLLTAQSQFAGFALNTTWHTSWREWLLVFGGFLPGLLLLPWLPRNVRASPAGVVACGMAALGVLLALAPEAVYVRDAFANRMNTVFKFYYQAWLLLGLAATWAAGAALASPRRAWAGALALAVALAGLACPLRALHEHFAVPLKHPLTLSAFAELKRTAPDEYRALRWLQRETHPNDVLAQAPGESYRPETCRLSAFSGRPALLGWQGHERQWRGAAYGRQAAGRVEALHALYTAASTTDVQRLAATWHLDYVYVGPEERARYGITPQREAVLRAALEPAFSYGAASLYRGRGR